MLFFSPWVLQWPITLPGLDFTAVPFEANLPKIRPADALAALTAGAYALAGWPGRRQLLFRVTRWWSVSLIGLTLLAVLSVAWAEHKGLAVAFAIRTALWVVVALRAACDDWPPALLAASLLAGLMVNATVGFGQVLTQRNLGLAVLGELPIDMAYVGVSVVGPENARLLRLYGLSGHPNVIGGYAAVALLLGIGLLAHQAPRRRLVALAAWSIGWAALLLTFSRSAWLAILIGLGAAALAMRRSRRQGQQTDFQPPAAVIVAIMLIGVVIWGAAFGSLLVSRVTVSGSAIEQDSVAERIDLLNTAVAMIARYPVLGAGIGNFGVASYHLTAPPTYLDWVHNIPLLIASELGLLGLAMWLTGIAALIALGLARWRQTGLTREQALGGGAIAAMLVIMLFDHYLWTSSQGVYVWAALTGWWVSSVTQTDEAHS